MRRLALLPMTAVLAALVLAGCGGGSGSGGGAGAGGGGGDTTPPTPPPISAGTLALNAREAGEAAGAAVTAQQKTAVKYATMYSAAATGGDSAKAQANAQMVLDADAAVVTAIEAAEDAVSLAQERHDSDGTSEADKATLMAAITAAEAAIKAAKTARAAKNADTTAIDTLAEAVLALLGTDDKKPQTAADKAKAVAAAVAAALAPTSSENGAALRVDHTTSDVTVPAAGAATSKAVDLNDATGQTWAEIVGAANVMDKRITEGEGTKAVKAASVNGVQLISSQEAGTVTDGTQVTTGIVFMGRLTSAGASVANTGIPGTVFCQGECSVKTVTGKAALRELVGDWYFTPTNAKQSYIMKAADDDGTAGYVNDTMYGRYGHWLAVADDGSVTVNTFGVTPGNIIGLVLSVGGDNTDVSATYTGKASGMSVHRTYDTNAKETGEHSGAFLADVTLNASFGTAPTLSGEVTNFTSDNPNAVGSDWTVKLMGADDAAAAGLTGGAATENGVAKGSGQAGTWVAQGYGTSGKRPTGFVGGFEAHFTDGDASGGFATRK